jgi:pilus assembly protein CpaB
MGRRTLLLIAALVVAALGTGLVFLYAQNAQNNAKAGQELVTVLVAKSKIELGTTGSAASSAGAFQETQVARDTVVPGALSDASPLANLVALVPIFPGQQIIQPQWGQSASTGGLAVPAGKVAIAVQLGDPQRVAGFVTPGSQIAIFTYGNTAPPGKGGSAPLTTVPGVKLLLTGIDVIAVGPTTTVQSTSGQANNQQVPTAILTLAVTQAEAQKIILASGQVGGSQYNGLYLALQTKDSAVSTKVPATNSTNLFG